MRLMIDTNVLIDALANREPRAADAKKLLAFGYVHEFDLWVSAGSLKDVLYVLSDGGKPARAQAALRAMDGLRDFVHICSLDEADIERLAHCTWHDPEDYLIELAAHKAGAEAIITANGKDFEKSSLHVMDCTQLFAWLETVKGLVFDIVDAEGRNA